MDQEIYLHAINAYYELYYRRMIIKNLESILKDNALLSRRLQGFDSSSGFNGMDYISLCDYQKRDLCHTDHPCYTSFDGYVKQSLSLVFPKSELSVINPYIISIIFIYSIM